MAVLDSVFIGIHYGDLKPLSPKHKCDTGVASASAGGNLLLSQLLLQSHTCVTEYHYLSKTKYFQLETLHSPTSLASSDQSLVSSLEWA